VHTFDFGFNFCLPPKHFRSHLFLFFFSTNTFGHLSLGGESWEILGIRPGSPDFLLVKAQSINQGDGKRKEQGKEEEEREHMHMQLTASATDRVAARCQHDAFLLLLRPSLTPPFHTLWFSFPWPSPSPPPLVLWGSKGPAIQFPNQGKLGRKTKGRKQEHQFLQQIEHSLCKSTFNYYRCPKELLQILIVPTTGIYHLNFSAAMALLIPTI
jgi:hypothetical protein